MTSAAAPSADAPAAARGLTTGAKFVLVNCAIVLAIASYIVAANGLSWPTYFKALGVLTKVSCLIFVLVMLVRPLHDLFRSRLTGRLLANRRYIGLTFAAWHLIHWPILTAMFIQYGPAWYWHYFKTFLIPALLILCLITAMAITTHDRIRKAMGARAWMVLHTLGIYVIAGWFIRTYVNKIERADRKGLEHETYWYIYLGLLLGAIALRLVLAVRRVVQRRSRA